MIPSRISSTPYSAAQPQAASGKRSPQFGSTWLPPHVIQTTRGALEVICRTHHFRQPELMRFLPEFLQQRFPTSEYPRMKVAVYAGADGSEARSIAMMLMDKLGRKRAQQFFLRSVDINPDMVERARKPVVTMNRLEHKLYSNLITKQQESLLMPMEKVAFRDVKHEIPFRISDDVLGMITHAQGDLMKDSRNKINAQVLFFRNAWDHLSPDKQEELAHNLYRNMDYGSVVVVGAETIDTGVRELLKRVGFTQYRETGKLNGVFIKNPVNTGNPFAEALFKAGLHPAQTQK